MCQHQYDISYVDLNPTFLFTCTIIRKEDEKRFHTHDYLEILCILSGRGGYHINEEYISVEAGDILIFNPGVYHEAIVSDKENIMTEFFIGITDFQFKGMEKNHLQLKNCNYLFHPDLKLRTRIMKLCNEIAIENHDCQRGRYFMLKAYATQLLLYVIREQLEPICPQKGYTFESTSKTYIVEQIINYMDQHYSEKISLDQIAKNMYLSPFYISKIFKSEVGEAPINYLINVRMEKAKEILEKYSDISIQKVAAEVGYEDAYHFSKLFKKHYGVSPSKYMKAI